LQVALGNDVRVPAETSSNGDEKGEADGNPAVSRATRKAEWRWRGGVLLMNSRKADSVAAAGVREFLVGWWPQPAFALLRIWLGMRFGSGDCGLSIYGGGEQAGATVDAFRD